MKFNCNSLLITCVAIFLIVLLTVFPAVAQIVGNKQSAGGIRAGASLASRPTGKQLRVLPEAANSNSSEPLASSFGNDLADGQPVIFALVVAYSTGIYPGQIAIGDANVDGYLDVVTSGSLLLGNGDGTFQPPVLISGTAMNVSVILGDVNRDGRLDAMVTDFGGAVIVLIDYPSGGFANQAVAIGDHEPRRPA